MTRARSSRTSAGGRRSPQIERLARHSQVPAVAAALMATPQLRFYHDHVLVKEAATAQRTPWHQDQPYYNVDGHGVSAWIAVDPVPDGGSLELLAGSHRGPWLMPRTFLTKQARWFPEGSLAELPDIDADPGAFDVRRFALQPGDAIFFDFLTVHGAPGFPYRSRRRVLSLRYLGGRHSARTPSVAYLAAVRPLGGEPARRGGHGSSAVSRGLAVAGTVRPRLDGNRHSPRTDGAESVLIPQGRADR
jgi:ectoine hydroxylase-related dioxygenase (phytanoyl-CoA dioxygenase family)